VSRPRAVFVTTRPPVHQKLALEAAPEQIRVDLLVSPDKATVMQALAGAEFLISERSGEVDAEIIAAGTELRLIQRLGARCHDIELVAAESCGVPVCVWPLKQSAVVAEHVMALVLSLTKRLRESAEVMLVEGDWGEPQECDANTFVMNWTGRTGIGMLTGASVGIVAMGEIGTELALRLQAFGCDVAYNNRRRLPDSAELRVGVRYLPIDDLLDQCSVVCLLVPFSPETVGMTDAVFLAKMQRGALLVSCGASTTLDEQAVRDAYVSGHLGGIATDGHRWEPAPPDGPLVSLSRDRSANVVLTPHSAQGDLQLTAQMRRPEYTNVMNVLADKPLLHRVV